MRTGSIEGAWWLPSSTDEKVPGTLSLAWDKSPRIELRGLLRPNDPSDGIRLVLTAGEGYPVLLGEAVDGQAVTLEGCRSSGGSDIHLDEPERSVVVLSAARAWLGAHILEPEAASFGSMRLKLSGLTDLATSPEVAQIGAATIELEATGGGGPPVDETSAAGNGSEAAELRATAANPLVISDWYDRYVRPLRALVALAIDENVAVDRMMFDLNGTGAAGATVEVVEKRRSTRRRNDRSISPQEMLFGMSSLPAGFQVAIGRWLDVAARLRAILDLFLGPILAPFMYEEHRFLNLVQAAEAYHRVVVDGTQLPPDEYERRVADAVEHCPAELQSWLRESLRYGNNLSSAARMKAPLADRPWMEPEVTGASPRFARRVIQTRNYHTHWDETTAAEAARGFELWPLCEQLTILLQACLLGELGFSVDEAAEAIRRASHHYSAIRFNPRLFPGAAPRPS